NSPTMCQMFVHRALQPVRERFANTIVYHYMDNILFCREQAFEMADINKINRDLSQSGLVIGPEKIQRTDPWHYLGWVVTKNHIRPQKLQLHTDLHTLHDVQKLLGDLQWVRQLAGISNADLAPLMPLLQGTDPAQPVHLTGDQRQCLDRLEKQLAVSVANRRLPDIPLGILIVNAGDAPFPLLCCTGGKQAKRSVDEICILEWVFPPTTPPQSIWQRTQVLAHLICKARARTVDISGLEPTFISLPIRTEIREWLIGHSEALQTALVGFTGQIIERYPVDPRLQVIMRQQWVEEPKMKNRPVQGITVFTDAGRKKKLAACTWMHAGQWEHHIIPGTNDDSLQTLELTAVAWALVHWQTEAINIVTDSLYVTGVVLRIEQALVKRPANKRLSQLFGQVQRAIQAHTQPGAILHIRSHMFIEGL
ncbi:POK18 protein, partial [Menura novaehollandiae]|nr:POK18 protein [Menura novaehollandiae]